MDQAELQAMLDRQVGRGGIVNVVLGVQSADGALDLTGAAGTADPQSGAAMTVDAFHCPETGLYLVGTVNQIASPRRAIMLMMRVADRCRQAGAPTPHGGRQASCDA